MKGFCDGISYYTEYRASIRVFFPEGREVCQYCPFLRHEDAFNRFFVRLLRPHNTTGYYHRSGSVRAGALLFPPEGTPIPPIEPGGEYDPFRKDDEK